MTSLRKRFSTATALSLGLLAMLVSAYAPAAASASAPTVPWGFNEDWGWSNGAFSATTATQHMQLAGTIMPDALSANRFHVQWAAIESKKGTYDWKQTDAVYAAMQQYTSRPIMMIYDSPVWARDPAATCPATCAYPPLPKYDSNWKNFVKAAAGRYRNVRAVEIWNEPNFGVFFAPAANASRYSTLLKTAHGAVVAAGNTAPVVTGGLLPVNTDGKNIAAKSFLDQVYVSAGAASFEGIGAHPYPHQAPYVDTMWTRLNALTAIRNKYGDTATPLWITEVGISTEPTTGVPADQQGDVLAELYHSIEGQNVASFVIHRLYDIGSDYWGRFGVLNADLTRKPGYCELGTAIGTAC